jgi:trimethyllysine dioxygenase
VLYSPPHQRVTQTDPCGVQLFHLLEHTGGTGGVSLLVDGFYVASILRDLHPDTYRLLSTVPIPSHAAGESGILYRAAHTPLEHEHEQVDDGNGNGRSLRAVRWNNDDRSALRSVPYADVPRLYEAMRVWDRLVTSQDSEYWVQLSPGSVLSMLRFLPPSPFPPIVMDDL